MYVLLITINKPFQTRWNVRLVENVEVCRFIIRVAFPSNSFYVEFKTVFITFLKHMRPECSICLKSSLCFFWNIIVEFL